MLKESILAQPFLGTICLWKWCMWMHIHIPWILTCFLLKNIFVLLFFFLTRNTFSMNILEHIPCPQSRVSLASAVEQNWISLVRWSQIIFQGDYINLNLLVGGTEYQLLRWVGSDVYKNLSRCRWVIHILSFWLLEDSGEVCLGAIDLRIIGL